MIPKFRIFDKKKKRFLDNFTMEIDRYGIHVLDEFNYVVDEDDRVLMQSTGLTDKNGKEIFEGDILKATYNTINDTKTDIKVINITDQVYKNYGCYYIDGYSFKELNNLEIIGNIHSHSHLLDNGGQQQ